MVCHAFKFSAFNAFKIFYIRIFFQKLLEYFYVGELNLEPHTVMPVWMTAAYLELPDVVAMCNDYCQRSVTCVSNQNMDEASKVSVVYIYNEV